MGGWCSCTNRAQVLMVFGSMFYTKFGENLVKIPKQKHSTIKNPINLDVFDLSFWLTFWYFRHYNNIINKKKGTMQKQIEQYIENIKKDYVGFGRPQTKTQLEL